MFVSLFRFDPVILDAMNNIIIVMYYLQHGQQCGRRSEVPRSVPGCTVLSHFFNADNVLIA